jgi:hypothetical protein
MKTISFRDLGNERSSELFGVALEVLLRDTTPNEPAYGIEGVRMIVFSASVAEVDQADGEEWFPFY